MQDEIKVSWPLVHFDTRKCPVFTFNTKFLGGLYFTFGIKMGSQFLPASRHCAKLASHTAFKMHMQCESVIINTLGLQWPKYCVCKGEPTMIPKAVSCLQGHFLVSWPTN